MNVSCENLGRRELLVDQIKYVGQIYRFDDFRITVEIDDYCVRFDIPSSEWLERFTEVLRTSAPAEFRETLRGSGWLFSVSRTEIGVSLDVFDIGLKADIRLDLSLEEAGKLHQAVLDALLLPFSDQGGQAEDLLDMDRFCYGNPGQ
jgi:hypothetical protein